jgi:hypothetical protein
VLLLPDVFPLSFAPINQHEGADEVKHQQAAPLRSLPIFLRTKKDISEFLDELVNRIIFKVINELQSTFIVKNVGREKEEGRLVDV